MDGMQPGGMPTASARQPSLARIELPTDYRRAEGIAVRAALLEASLDAQQCQVLALATQRLNVELADAVSAAFAVLLHRHSQQTELALDLVVQAGESEGPSRPQTLAYRTCQLSFADDSNFASVLPQLSAALRSQEAPALGTGSNIAFSASIDTSPSSLLSPSGQPARELALLLTERPAGVDLQLAYDAERFRPERIGELLEQLRLLLFRLLDAPQHNVLDHSLVTGASRARLPDPSRAVDQRTYPTLGDAFAARAASAPYRVAIRQAGRTLSYGELAHHSERIAQHLRTRIASGDVVAVTGPRSPALVGALLGVFRSGAVLLTLDPSLPLERRRVMLEQAGAKLLLAADFTTADHAALATAACPLVLVSNTGQIEGAPSVATSDLPRIDPDQPAYVFFTSGSTGVPKAVLGRHKGLAHFLAWQREEFDIQASDRASQLTALSFDVVLRDMFLALTSGACLCLPECADVTDPARILSWLAQERVSVLHVVPSLARLWLSHVPEGLRLPDLRRVFFAGEPLSDVLVTRCRELFGPQVEIINLYGPTETTLAKCFHRIPAVPDPGVQSIGRPLSHTQVLILNRRRQLCGLHEAGEIAIRTPYRSLGYVNNPDANARVFIANPFGTEADDLVYLTGDSGRYRADGTLEILGRIDGQVKIRGVRIEPGEIEAALGHHPSVREVVVVARQDESEAKFLAAYVVPRTQPSDPASLIAELRAFLRGRLPEVMVPSAFGIVPALPLNANGKVDKKALPAIERAMPVAASAAPSSERERELAAIWCEVLQLPEVGVHDSFYDLGGDSLTAARVIIRMRVLGVPESVCRAILQGRTIAELARAAEDGEVALDDPARPLNQDARSRLMLNAFRGALIALILFDHFAPGLARRFELVQAHYNWVYPLFNWGTPGFAMIFGVTLGFVYHPQYVANAERTRLLLWRGAAIVGAGAALLTCAAWAMAASGLSPQAAHETPYANVLSFYALGMATAGVWFRLLGSRSATRNAFLSALACGFIHHTIRRFSVGVPAHSPILLLLGKWGYFNMWIGSMLGFMFGQRLKRQGIVASRDMLLGAVLIALGFGLSLLQDLDSAFLSDQHEVAYWRWIFYGGITIWALVGFERVIASLPGDAFGRRLLNVLAVVGQLTMPLFLLQYLSWALGMLCTAAGWPSSVRFSIEFGTLFVVGYMIIRRLYRFYYGGERGVLIAPLETQVNLPA